MDEATLLEIIREMHQKRDYSQIVEKVPYETRYSLFMNDVGRKYIDVVYYSMIDHLFTPEEAETLYNQIEDKRKKKDLFFLLEDKRKLELVDEVELDQWSSRKFVSSIKDDSTRLEMSIKFLNKGLINTFSISTFFEVLSAENKFTFLDKVLSKGVLIGNGLIFGPRLISVFGSYDGNIKFSS